MLDVGVTSHPSCTSLTTTSGTRAKGKTKETACRIVWSDSVVFGVIRINCVNATTVSMSYSYMCELPAAASARYKSKLHILGLDTCPYQHLADSWLNNPKGWPKVAYHDVYHYLIKTSGMYLYRKHEKYFFLNIFINS